MPKNIIFCADGTWNGPGADDENSQDGVPTNVFKTFLNLAGADSIDGLRLADEQERVFTSSAGEAVQVAKYLHGVGDSRNKLVWALGGSVGAGLITRIVRGYTFVSRNYEEGDRIFLIGFSRGAYTARSLGGLIAARGLLDGTRIDLTDKEKAYRAGCTVWYDFRKAGLETNKDAFGALEETVLDLPAFVSHPGLPPLVSNIPIKCIAVWDTVGALGIPEYNNENCRIDAFQFCDTRLSDSVEFGFHAISLDEQRADFTPTLWDSTSRITQILFPGAHADVGGGYKVQNDESGLSDGALAWMSEELKKVGVIYADKSTVTPNPNPAGIAHQPWLSPPWPDLKPGPQPRTFPSGLILHNSILKRMNGGNVYADPSLTAASYNPLNLGAYVVNGKPAAGVTVV